MYAAYSGPPGHASQFHGRSGAQLDRGTIPSGAPRAGGPSLVGAQATPTATTATTSTASRRRRRTMHATASDASAAAASPCPRPSACSAGCDVVVVDVDDDDEPPGPPAGTDGVGALGTGGAVEGGESAVVLSTLVSGFLPVVESTTWSFRSWAVPSSSRTRTPLTSLPTQTGSVMFSGATLATAAASFEPGSGPLSTASISDAFRQLPCWSRTSTVNFAPGSPSHCTPTRLASVPTWLSHPEATGAGSAVRSTLSVLGFGFGEGPWPCCPKAAAASTTTDTAATAPPAPSFVWRDRMRIRRGRRVGR